jgi:hypothetical protein
MFWGIRAASRCNSSPTEALNTINLLAERALIERSVTLAATAVSVGECTAGSGSICADSLFGDDHPLLPGKDGDIRMKSRVALCRCSGYEQAQLPTEDSALPIGKQYLLLLGLIFSLVAIICAVVLQGAWLRTLGELIFGRYVFFWLTLCIAMVLTDTAQSWMTWLRLRELLLHLDRLPVRRTLYALQGLSWRSVWAMSGNVLTERYSLVSRQIEALRHLQNQVAAWKPTETADLTNQKTLLDTISALEKNELKEFVDWYVSLDGAPVTSVEDLEAVQKKIASIAAFALSAILIPSWRTEKDSLIFDRARKPNAASEEHSGPVISSQIAAHVLAAEEFFVCRMWDSSRIFSAGYAQSCSAACGSSLRRLSPYRVIRSIHFRPSAGFSWWCSRLWGAR